MTRIFKPNNFKPRRRPRHLEDSLQETCVAWFRLRYPGKFIFAIPNGGRRGLLEAIRLKKQGVTRGVPDLLIPEPMRGFHGLWIEMKTKEGRASADQKQMLAALKARGYETHICRSFEEFQNIVTFYFEGKLAA